MKIEKAKQIASEILNVGKNKIYIAPEELDRVKEAMTREDIKGLIEEGIIGKRKEAEQSRGRSRKIKIQKKKGRRKGYGSRKGKKSARVKRKDSWCTKVRSLRAKLRELKKAYPERIKELGYRRLYNLIKGGFFRSKAHLEKFIKGA